MMSVFYGNLSFIGLEMDEKLINISSQETITWFNGSREWDWWLRSLTFALLVSFWKDYTT
jgi:hypothetical protein